MDIPLFPNGGDFDGQKLINLATGVAGTDGVNVDQLNAAIVGAVDFQGDYNPVTNTPDLVTPAPGVVNQGDLYVVSTPGTFFGQNVEAGDWLLAKNDDPSTFAEWTVVQTNIYHKYVNDYFVSDDHGDDSNDGLSERFAFKTLEKALDTGESVGVPFSVHLLDRNSYEVTEDTATPGIRTTLVPFRVSGPVATLVGQSGGVVWKTQVDQLILMSIDGTNLTFTPTGTGGDDTIHNHYFNNIKDPNTLYKSEPGDGGGHVYSVLSNRSWGDGMLCDFTITPQRTVASFSITYVRGVLNGSGRQYYMNVDGPSVAALSCLQIDTPNQGAGDGWIVNADNGARVYITGQCQGASPANGANSDNGSRVYIEMSDFNTMAPVINDDNGGSGIIYDYNIKDGTNPITQVTVV